MTTLRKFWSSAWETSRRIEIKEFAQERTLQQSKWFDYRYMTPLEATMVMKSAYVEAYRALYARNVDSREADQKTGCRPGKFGSNRTEFTSLWRLRQFADELGVPYDFFVRTAMECLMEHYWQRIPIHNQLYGPRNREKIADAVLSRWAEANETILKVSKLPQYRNENFVGDPAQVAHRSWVLEQLKTKHRYSGYLAAIVYEQRLLPEEVAIREFGVELVGFEKEKASAEREAPVEVLDRRMGFLPACFALPNTIKPHEAPCSDCKCLEFCVRAGAQFQAKITAWSKKSPGSYASERKKLLQRQRTARFRAKQKAQAAASTQNHTGFVSSLP